MLTENPVSELKCEARPVDVLAEQEKNYYCQRCLNHGELNPRKGHKPDCGYLKCPCPECTMVEQRRQLNNMLSKKKVHIAPATQTRNGKRVRDPHCARCSAHGVLVPLRGHKRSMCQFVTCTCQLCSLVENRRMLMAAQIKLRRSQQKNRDGVEPKTKRVRKMKEMSMVDLKQLMMVVTTDSDQKRSGTSTSPSPASTIDTMSPSLSISPPPSPSPIKHSLIQTTPLLAAPIPVYPQSIPTIQQIQQQILLNYIQSLAPPPIQQTSVLPNFNELGVLMYLKGCLQI